MGQVNYPILLTNIVKPLVSHPDDVNVLVVEEQDKYVKLQVVVNDIDTGRIIGKKGRIANAIRTIVHAASIRDDMRIDVEFGKEELVQEQE